MARVRVSPLVTLVPLVAVLLAGCGGSGSTSQAELEEMETTPVVGAPATPTREPAPAIEGTTLEGERISLKSLRGRPVFVNVWSSW